MEFDALIIQALAKTKKFSFGFYFGRSFVQLCLLAFSRS